jgi:hypothetical protein
MNLVFIHGPAASGKLTIARELSKLTHYPVFHNHLIVDAVGAVFEFGSEPFVRLRQQMWLSVFQEAAAARRSLIFTFAPENSVPEDFVPKTLLTVEADGGHVLFVRLVCPVEEQERRIENPSRVEFRKLRSVDVLRRLRESGGSQYRELPDSGLTIDTSLCASAEAAERILGFFALSPAAAPHAMYGA